MDLRTALAAVLGVGLGLVLVAYPDAVVRAHSVGRLPQDRRGEYGSESTTGDRTRTLVRAVGVLLVLLGGYFALDATSVVSLA